MFVQVVAMKNGEYVEWNFPAFWPTGSNVAVELFGHLEVPGSDLDL
jgi:hypothetical protein